MQYHSTSKLMAWHCSNHWLRVPMRIGFKLAFLCLLSSAWHYLDICLVCSTMSLICRWEVNFGCPFSDLFFVVFPSLLVTVGAIHSWLLDRDSGTVYLMTSSLPHHWQYLVKNLNHIYSGNHSPILFCRIITTMVLEDFTLANINNYNVM